MIHQIFFASCIKKKKNLATEFNPRLYISSFWPLAAFLSGVCFPDVVVDMQILLFNNSKYIEAG